MAPVIAWARGNSPDVPFLAPKFSGGPKGGHLKMGFCTEIRTRHVDFALKFALDTSILTALSKAIRQGKHCLNRASAI